MKEEAFEGLQSSGEKGLDKEVQLLLPLFPDQRLHAWPHPENSPVYRLGSGQE